MGVCPDHPRVGGEHQVTKPWAAPAIGSSPRWRGAQLGATRDDLPDGIIPALAGSTVQRVGGYSAGQDHPRVGGEHDPVRRVARAAEGSSPRWRGALLEPSERAHVEGIIPALAGSTWPSRASGRPSPDHPRVGGEHVPISVPSSLYSGSSPRWRGAHWEREGDAYRERIIPALAGST